MYVVRGAVYTCTWGSRKAFPKKCSWTLDLSMSWNWVWRGRKKVGGWCLGRPRGHQKGEGTTGGDTRSELGHVGTCPILPIHRLPCGVAPKGGNSLKITLGGCSRGNGTMGVGDFRGRCRSSRGWSSHGGRQPQGRRAWGDGLRGIHIHRRPNALWIVSLPFAGFHPLFSLYPRVGVRAPAEEGRTLWLTQSAPHPFPAMMASACSLHCQRLSRSPDPSPSSVVSA